VSALRRYLLPVFAAFITLAIGIALGAGPLQQAEGSDDSGSLRTTNQKLLDQLAAGNDARVFDRAWSDALAPGLLTGRLTDAHITIVVLPGVSSASVDATRQAIQAAGGSTAMVVTVAAAVLDSAKKTYVSSVADSSLAGADGVTAPPEDDVYPRFGTVLARAYVSRSDDTRYDATATKIDSELQGANLVELDQAPLRRGSLVVVLASGAHGDDKVVTANVIAADLVTALARAGDAVVVTTPATGRSTGGLLADLADNRDVARLPVSTANAGTSSSGLVTTVYALATALDGRPGDYGVVDGEPVLPPGVESATD
jgi:hypothetical protein